MKGMLNVSVFFLNTLISFYSKFGHISRASNVFDKMHERSDASWNTMMSGFVHAGLYQESIIFFRKMLSFPIKPSGFAISSLVTACNRLGCMFSEGIAVHSFVVKLGILYDVFVATSFVHFYGSYGFAFCSSKLFEEMPEKNVVTWTALMVAYLDYGNPVEVMNIYFRMRYEGLHGNGNTLAALFSSCASLEDKVLGNHILGHVIKNGLLFSNVSVANSVISMFGCFGCMKDASCVFNGMQERDTISWNSIIYANVRNNLQEESLRYFYWMRYLYCDTDSTTFSSLLSGCNSVDYLGLGRGVHCLVLKIGLDSSVCICNTLISVYFNMKNLENAELVFQGMSQRDLISWNAMIAGYAQYGRCIEALEYFLQIFYGRKDTYYVTFASALAACSDYRLFSEGKKLHALVIVTGLVKNSVVGNALISLYAKNKEISEAKMVFETMFMKDDVTWSTLVGAHAENGEPLDALKAFKLMRQEGSIPNCITIANILGAFTGSNDLLEHGMGIHAFAVQIGFETEEYVVNSLITMYAKCGDLLSSNHIFNWLNEKSVVSWNAIISANAYHNCVEEALKLLVQMRCAGVHLCQFSFSECLAATAKLAILEEGQQLHNLAIKVGLDSDPFVLNAAMDMYTKCGEIDDVLNIIPQPLDRQQLSWNILISCFARHGYFIKAKETFHEMLLLGVKPDHVTFVSLLSACSHGGLVEDGLGYYDLMGKVFGVPAGIEHCVCVIDLLGRAGRLVDAETFINQMQIPVTDHVWRSLLAACKTHGNLEIGRKAAANLFWLDPSDDSAYVLFSNICASNGRWKEAENVRRQMGTNRIKKKPACSWVKMRDKVSSFGIGEQSHPQISQINAKLEELRKMIMKAGYVPDTSHALHDTDEEQREHNLWNHSERLALAFALISTPEHSTVKIFKNLRVCGDCHSVYKFISGILGRKIILRDTYRFHHFSDSNCSCFDFW